MRLQDVPAEWPMMQVEGKGSEELVKRVTEVNNMINQITRSHDQRSPSGFCVHFAHCSQNPQIDYPGLTILTIPMYATQWHDVSWCEQLCASEPHTSRTSKGHSLNHHTVPHFDYKSKISETQPILYV
jgi:hypothetical protein